MKKPISTYFFVGLVVIVVVAAVISVALIINNTHSTSNQDKKDVASGACGILTSSIAQKIVGNNAKKVFESESTAASVQTSYCDYTGSSGLASLALRSPLTQAAINANTELFNNGKPAGSQVINGYGSAAYWSPAYYQLNILDHNDWYTLSAGSVNPTKLSLSRAEQFAKLIIN